MTIAELAAKLRGIPARGGAAALLGDQPVLHNQW